MFSSHCRAGPNEGAQQNRPQANIAVKRTGAQPDQPQATKKPKRLINNIAQTLQEKNYDEFKVPQVQKEYKAKFKNLDDEEREMTWTNQPPNVSGRRRAQDVVKGPVKVPLGIAKNANTHLAAFELFMDEKIISQIVKLTNKKIQSVRSQFSEELLRKGGQRYEVTNIIELRAFIGLCYLRGILRVSKQSIEMLFGPDGHHAFGATMSVKRFAFLN